MTEIAHAPTGPADTQSSAFDAQAPLQDSTIDVNRDSGVFLSDTEESQSVSSRPSSIISSSARLQRTASTASTSSHSRSDSTRTDRRLRRPAELNLGKEKIADPTRAKSELELRYDLIRNSQTQSKAMLKSPTQLLKDRLNLSPKKRSHEKLRKFTPPKPMLNGCILPGPSAQLEAFTGKDVRACTESGKTAWWCKFDKLVVFDGVDETSANENDIKFKTRSSKGLSIARRRGDCETVVIPLECTHCQEMLNRSDWKYDIQVCKRSVCWDCKERCLWEMNNAQREPRLANGDIPAEREQNRERADSVLQDEEREQEEELLRKVGIESVLMSASPLELD